MTNYLRPDEESSQSRIEASNKRDKKIKTGVKSALSIATAVSGYGIAHKILPFLSNYIPSELAVKGISKISPKIGNFLKRGMESGLNVKDGLDFLREGLNGKEEKQKEDPYKPLLGKLGQMKDRLSNLESEFDQGQKPISNSSAKDQLLQAMQQLSQSLRG